jgi:hypothetical protein
MALSDIARPAKHDLTVVCGDSFSRTFTVRDSAGAAIDLTGFVGRAQVRDRAGGALLADFLVTIAAPTTGVIVISLRSSQTYALPSIGGVWDLELDGGETATHTLIGGRVVVQMGVTSA